MPEEPNQNLQRPQNPVPTQPAPPAVPPAEPTPPPAAAPPANTATAPSQQSYGAGQFVSQPQPQPPLEAKSKRLSLMLIVVGGLLVLVAIAASLFFLASSKHISAQNVTTAQQAANTLSSDISDISSDLFDASNADTSSQLTAKLNATKTKLADAQGQYGLLSKSRVLADKPTDQKFKALTGKWQPFTQTLNQDLSDETSLDPIVLTFENGSTALDNQTPQASAASYKAFLNSYQTLVNTATTQLKAMKPLALKGFQQEATAQQAELQAFSKAIATAQSGLAAGTDIYSIDSTLYSSFADAQLALSTSLDGASKTVSNQFNQSDPSGALLSFQSALNNLQTTVSTKTK